MCVCIYITRAYVCVYINKRTLVSRERATLTTSRDIPPLYL